MMERRRSTPGLVLLEDGALHSLFGLDDMTADWPDPRQWYDAVVAAGFPIGGGEISMTSPTGARRSFHLTPVEPTGGVAPYTVQPSFELRDGVDTNEHRARLQAVLDVNSASVWAIDGDLRLIAFNQRFYADTRAAFGADFKLGDLVLGGSSPLEQRQWKALYQQVLNGELIDREVSPAAPMDDAIEPTHQLAMGPIEVGGRIIGVAAFLHDITLARQQALAVARQNTMLDALTKAQARYIGDKSPNQVFADLLESVLDLTGSTFGFLGEVRYDIADAPYLISRAISDRGWDEETQATFNRSRDSGMEFRNMDALLGRVMLTGEPVADLDVFDPRTGGPLAGLPTIEAFMGLPCYHGSRLMGMVAVANRKGGYDQSEPDFLKPLLSTVAAVITARRSERHRQAAEDALVKAKEAAEAADRAKGDFLASMSHEIRTPLNAVMGLIELALDGASNDDQKALLQAARGNSETLLNLISDVLDFSRIDAGRIELDVAPFDLRRLVEDVAEVMAVRAEEKGLSLVAAVPPRIPSPVVGDPHRLRQVLTNLVSNALKYTDEGEVVIEVSASAGDDGVAAVLEVRDTGCGIPADQHERIFERFHRVKATAMMGGGGTGLGLAITRFLVEQMGGQIAVDSQIGVGSRFRVELPLSTAAETGHDGPGRWLLSEVRAVVVHPPGGAGQWIAGQLAAFGAQVERVSDPVDAHWLDRADVILSTVDIDTTRPMIRLSTAATLGRNRSSEADCLTLPVRRDTLLDAVMDRIGVARGPQSTPMLRPISTPGGSSILLVEDHHDNRATARRLLENQGHIVEEAEHGGIAVARAREAAYDVILMDLHMPEVDGFEATEQIRRNEEAGGLSRVPIVAVTAHATADVRRRCLSGGFDGFVAKPITGRSLGDAVESHALTGPSALVIDDAPDSRRLLIRILRRHTDMRVHEAADGATAIGIAEKSRPEVALIDAVLPGENGFDIARNLRAMLGSSATLLMVSGRTDAEARRLAEEAGCDGFVLKPVRRAELLSAIEGGRRRQRSPTTPPAPPVVYIDDDFLDLIPSFLDDRRRDLDAIAQAVKDDDMVVIARIGHSMKGSGRAYGMDPISDLGARLEAAAKTHALPSIEAARAAIERFVSSVDVRPDSARPT